jgi:tetratricopeptide (TPR) repeat protein
MKKIIVIIVTLFAGGVFAEVMALRNLTIGSSYPPFCAEQLNGSQVCSDTYKDTILVTSFVRPDQKKSLEVLQVLQDLYTRYHAKGVSIAGIVSGEFDRQKLVVFIEKNEIAYPLLLDNAREIYGNFGVFAYPTIVIFGQDGTLKYLFGSNTINIGQRIDGCIGFLSAEIDASELENIMHPVVEKIDYERSRAERYYKFAKIYFQRKQFSKARQIVESSLENYTEHALTYSLYGHILLKEENYTLGLKQFEQALELDPGLEEAKTGRRHCLDHLIR